MYFFKVWNCDDCRTARGMKPLGNIKKFRAEVADLVKKAAAKSFFANRSMLGYEDSDSLDAQVPNCDPVKVCLKFSFVFICL